jgi:hypothetical protein
MWTRVLVLAPCVLVACTRTSNIAPDFARHFECPENQVTVDYDLQGTALSEHYIARGCGQQAVFYCDTGECVSPQIVVSRRYARQHGCYVHQVDVRYLDGGAWRASGCGPQVVYQCAQSAEYTLRCFAETSEQDKTSVKSSGK